jgi:hypothetical protein
MLDGSPVPVAFDNAGAAAEVVLRAGFRGTSCLSVLKPLGDEC